MAKITNVEQKYAANGNTYRQITVDEGIGNGGNVKDRFNIFENHSKYDKCVVGADIPSELLFINEREYLDLKDEQAKPKRSELNEMAIKTHIDQWAKTIITHIQQLPGYQLPPQKIAGTDIDFPQDEGYSEPLKEKDVPF